MSTITLQDMCTYKNWHDIPQHDYQRKVPGKSHCGVLDQECGLPNRMYKMFHPVRVVEETENALRVRLTRHRSDTNHQHIEKPVAQHFNLMDNSINDLSIMVIEKSTGNTLSIEKEKKATG